VSERQGGDSGGREFHRVAEALRVRITDGTYPLRSFLPSQRDLAEELGVSRDTVQRVLRELVDQGWIESRQGSGSRVVKAPSLPSEPAGRLRQGAGVGAWLSEAFEQPEVDLYVYTLTSESLDAHIRLQAERILSGAIAPQRIALRMILPSAALTVPYPQVKGDPDDPRLRDRLHAITQRHTDSLRSLLNDLKTERFVPSVDLEIRYSPLPPAFKLYLLNGTEALMGPYEVIERRIVLDSGEEVDALDVLGLGARLTHHVKDADPLSTGSVFVDSWQAWFDSVWKLLAEQ
jgi:biotin operon repressor